MSHNLFSHCIIAAVRTDDEFQLALSCASDVIFDLAPDIFSLAQKVHSAHARGKKIFAHLDLASGIGKDKSGILFAKQLGLDGIISTRVSTIKLAREQKLFTVQRFFIVDSKSIFTTVEACKSSKPDMIEIMPGVIPKAIEQIKSLIDIPVIAGGMIESYDEIQNVIAAGASAVSTGKEKLWNLKGVNE